MTKEISFVKTKKNLSGWWDYIDYFDLFGKSLKIQILGKDKRSTTFGSIIGIISILSIIALSSFFLNDLFNRNNVHIMYNQVKDMTPVNNLTESPLIFKLIDETGKPIEPDGVYQIDVKMMQHKPYRTEDGKVGWSFNMENVNYSKCDSISFDDKYKKLYEEFPILDQYYCLVPNTNNLTIFGTTGDTKNGLNYLNFHINKCSNHTQTNCKGNNEINEKLSNSYFSITFLDNQIDHNNVTKVSQEILKTSALSMDPYLHKRYFYYIRQVLYDTDLAYIFEDHQINYFYQHENYQVDVKLPEAASASNSFSNFGTVSIINDNKIDYYFRTYDKIQNLMANVGGIIKGIFITCHIINYIFTRNYSIFQITNSLFDFEETKDLIHTSYKNKIFKTNMNSNQSNQNSMNNLNKTDDQKNCLNEINKNIKTGDKNIILNNFVVNENSGNISNIKINISDKFFR